MAGHIGTRRKVAGVACATCWIAFAQPVSPPVNFSAAALRVSIAGPTSRFTAVLTPDGRYEIRAATLLDLIQSSYGINAARVFGGPKWIEKDRFDLSATAPPHAAANVLRLMLRSLLKDRFNLTVHMDSKALPAYVLTVGKKAHLTRADERGLSGCVAKSQSDSTGDAAGTPKRQISDGTITVVCRNVSMSAFTDAMPSFPRVDFGRTSILDRTGLSGVWNFQIRYSFGRPHLANSEGWISLIDAIDKQLGLKLEQQTVGTSIVVIDGVNERPISDSPGVDDAFLSKPSPSKFEVAVVKRSLQRQMPRYEIQSGGRFVVQGIQLRALLKSALTIDNDRPIVGLPEWADTDLFDITAQAPPGSDALTLEAIRPMLRALLIERFRLETHSAEQAVSIYQLVALKPKLVKNDSGGHGHCENSSSNPTSPVGSSITVICRNATMSEFAAQLRVLARQSINRLVEDGTGLEGGWDFTLRFNPSVHPPEPVARDTASEPDGAISVFDALQKQLGLKLETRTRSIPVTIVDKIERQPADN